MKTLAIVIHGFCKGAKDMQLWKRVLKSDFTEVITPDLPTRYSSFECCVERLKKAIASAAPEQYDGIYFAGHSMGGLLAREYLKAVPLTNAKRLVCVGTPHYGSKLADIALLLPGAGLIWKPLHALKLSARKELTTPIVPGLEIGTIISTNNAHWPGKLFLSKSADGLVESSSAHAPDACAVAYTDAAHVPMMYDMQTAELIRKFLLTGKF